MARPWLATLKLAVPAPRAPAGRRRGRAWPAPGEAASSEPARLRLPCGAAICSVGALMAPPETGSCGTPPYTARAPLGRAAPLAVTKAPLLFTR